MYRAPGSPTPSGGHGTPLHVPPVSPVSPVPPMRRPQASVQQRVRGERAAAGPSGARGQAVEGARRPGGRATTAAACPARQPAAQQPGAALQRQRWQLQAPARDRYERLALMDAGWDTAEAAAVCSAQPPRVPAGGNSSGSIAGSTASSRRSSGSRTARASVGPVQVRKVDRVSRYHELAARWSRDRCGGCRPAARAHPQGALVRLRCLHSVCWLQQAP